MITRDVWTLARQLAPHSARVRAYLAMIARNGDKAAARWPNVEGQLRRICAAVMREIGIDEWGEFRPDPWEADELPASLAGAVRFIQRWEYLDSVDYVEQLNAANRNGANPDLVEWLDMVLRRFQRWGVPLYASRLVVDEAEHAALFVSGQVDLPFGKAPDNFGMAVELAHGTMGRNLPAASWRAIVEPAQELALSLRLDIVNEGEADLNCWWRWSMPTFERLTRNRKRKQEAEWAPGTLRPSQYSRSAPGEVAMLMEHYGIQNEPFTGDHFGPASWGLYEAGARYGALAAAREVRRFMLREAARLVVAGERSGRPAPGGDELPELPPICESHGDVAQDDQARLDERTWREALAEWRASEPGVEKTGMF